MWCGANDAVWLQGRDVSVANPWAFPPAEEAYQPGETIFSGRTYWSNSSLVR